MATIQHCKGNLLAANTEALVNTVNTVGVMGKGIALQFRKAFPQNYRAYRHACERGDVQAGRMFVFETGQMVGPRLLVNFPTKRHWRGRARMEYIETGLEDLASVLRRYDVHSIAIPALGCGNGGLRWTDVRPRIEAALAPFPDLRIELYGLNGPPPVHEQQTATKRPRMTRGRAALILAFATYRRDPTSALTLRAAQKLAYLLQMAGEPLRLQFAKAEYGPYAETLNPVLQTMEGHFTSGYGDRTTVSDLRLLDGVEAQARACLQAKADAAEHVERIGRLISGFESPLGLELLTTVHWAATYEEARTPEEARTIVAAWTPRKREVFGDREVAIAWEQLLSEGWLHGPVAQRVS